MHIITVTFPDGGTVIHEILAHHVNGPHGLFAIIKNFRDAGLKFTHYFVE